jgi:hypothetical protein
MTQKKVTIVKGNLSSEVFESSVGAWERNGWTVSDVRDGEEEEAVAKKATAKTASSESKKE